MPIPVNCSCGRALRIKDELAGRQIYCPTCKSVLLVPQPASEREPEPETDLEIVEDEPGYEVIDGEDDDRPRKKKSREADEGVQTTRRASRSASGGVDEDDEDDERSRREERRRDDERAERRAERREEEDREDRRRRRRRREEARRIERMREPRASFSGDGWFGSTNAGVVGGLVMVVLGIAGVGIGLAAGYICFWPIILTVIGIIAIIKGLANG
jgi:hypothetical protein